MEKVLLAVGIAVLLGASVYMLHQESAAPLTTEFKTEVDPQVFDLYQDWKKKYNKKYDTADQEQYRLSVFNTNYATIKEFYEGPEQTYTLDFNQFMDITAFEFTQTYLGLSAKPASGSIYQASGEEASPVDWRDKGVLNAVKNQGQCGSCWAFSAIGAIEATLAIAGQGLNSLSEQQLCDCSRGYGNEGCNGGLMDFAFQYVVASGISTEAAYPYKARDAKCNKSATSDFKITGFSDIPEGDCAALASAVQGRPVSVAVDANNWQFYSSGVFSKCGTSLDHGVVLVASDESAWTIRNSWAAGWGEEGHIRLAKGNTCGICNAASFPIA